MLLWRIKECLALAYFSCTVTFSVETKRTYSSRYERFEYPEETIVTEMSKIFALFTSYIHYLVFVTYPGRHKVSDKLVDNIYHLKIPNSISKPCTLLTLRTFSVRFVLNSAKIISLLYIWLTLF